MCRDLRLRRGVPRTLSRVTCPRLPLCSTSALARSPASTSRTGSWHVGEVPPIIFITAHDEIPAAPTRSPRRHGRLPAQAVRHGSAHRPRPSVALCRVRRRAPRVDEHDGPQAGPMSIRRDGHPPSSRPSIAESSRSARARGAAPTEPPLSQHGRAPRWSRVWSRGPPAAGQPPVHPCASCSCTACLRNCPRSPSSPSSCGSRCEATPRARSSSIRSISTWSGFPTSRRASWITSTTSTAASVSMSFSPSGRPRCGSAPRTCAAYFPTRRSYSRS